MATSPTSSNRRSFSPSVRTEMAHDHQMRLQEQQERAQLIYSFFSNLNRSGQPWQVKGHFAAFMEGTRYENQVLSWFGKVMSEDAKPLVKRFKVLKEVRDSYQPHLEQADGKSGLTSRQWAAMNSASFEFHNQKLVFAAYYADFARHIEQKYGIDFPPLKIDKEWEIDPNKFQVAPPYIVDALIYHIAKNFFSSSHTDLSLRLRSELLEISDYKFWQFSHERTEGYVSFFHEFVTKMIPKKMDFNALLSFPQKRFYIALRLGECLFYLREMHRTLHQVLDFCENTSEPSSPQLSTTPPKISPRRKVIPLVLPKTSPRFKEEDTPRGYELLSLDEVLRKVDQMTPEKRSFKPMSKIEFEELTRIATAYKTHVKKLTDVLDEIIPALQFIHDHDKPVYSSDIGMFSAIKLHYITQISLLSF